MNIVILGAGGLIGHKLFQSLSARFENVYGTLNSDSDHPMFKSDNVFRGVNVQDFKNTTQLLKMLNADVVLNCVGITKRKPEINNIATAIEINSLFPHKLASWAADNKKRIIHFSTDCVFDGSLGNYTEESQTTGYDTYGRTKALGEIDYPHTLTIRSSFIGRELVGKSELLEWSLANANGTIKGFSDAWYSGISTIEMSRVVGDIIESHPQLSGLKQLSTHEPISKLKLLEIANKSFGLNQTIIDDSSFSIKPTLDGSILRSTMDTKLPDWPKMMDAIAADKLTYL